MATLRPKHTNARVHTPLTGESSAAADVAAALRSARFCWRCICAKTHITPQELDDALAALLQNISAELSLAPCEHCGRDTLLYTLA